VYISNSYWYVYITVRNKFQHLLCFLNFKIERQFGLMLGALMKIIAFQEYKSVSQPGFGGHSKNNEDTSHKVALMKALHTK